MLNEIACFPPTGEQVVRAKKIKPMLPGLLPKTTPGVTTCYSIYIPGINTI